MKTRGVKTNSSSGKGKAMQKKTVEEGLRQLAFGDISDVIRLLYALPEEQQLKDMDFFNISELKRGKDGVWEIKFYDRMAALECLERVQNSREEIAPLYQALKESCRMLSCSKEEASRLPEEEPHDED